MKYLFSIKVKLKGENSNLKFLKDKNLELDIVLYFPIILCSNIFCNCFVNVEFYLLLELLFVNMVLVLKFKFKALFMQSH